MAKPQGFTAEASPAASAKNDDAPISPPEELPRIAGQPLNEQVDAVDAVVPTDDQCADDGQRQRRAGEQYREQPPAARPIFQ